MNYLLHRQKFPNSEVRVPDGLKSLMGDICREVLRAQTPNDELYPFIANYLEALLITRDKIQITQKTLCDIISKSTNIAELLVKEGITLEKANEAVNIMRKNFFELFDEKRDDRFDDIHLREMKEAQVIAELVEKCELTKNEVCQLQPAIQEAFLNFIDEYFRALRGMTLKMEVVSPILKFTLEKYFENIPSVEVMNHAAIVIQASFRGYRTRKYLNKANLPGSERIEVLELRKFKQHLRMLASSDYVKVNKAATIIQRAFRKSYGKTRLCSNSVYKRFSSEVLKEVMHESIRYDDYVYNIEDIPQALDVINKEYRDYKAREEQNLDKNEEYHQKFGHSDRIVEHAVLVIQKAFRDFLNKRRMHSGRDTSRLNPILGQIHLDEKFEELAREFGK